VVALAVLGAGAGCRLGARHDGRPRRALDGSRHRGRGRRAIREAIAAGSAHAARTLAREHVLSSNGLIEVVLETLGAAGREPGWGR
jgi:DNA-binding GntR family transcriptional regulator